MSAALVPEVDADESAMKVPPSQKIARRRSGSGDGTDGGNGNAVQTGWATRKLVSRVPSRASRSMFGVARSLAP